MDTSQPLDNRIEIVTPENIAFQYEVAGPMRRLPAYLLDLGLRTAVLIGLVIIFSILGGMLQFAGLPGMGMGMGLVLVSWFVLAWFYGGLFETYWNGQTPGKRLLQIRVVTIEGQPINGLQAVLRNVLRAVDALPPPGFFLLGAVTTMMNDRFQRLGDLAAGTMVVIEKKQWYGGVAKVYEAEALRLASLIPPSFEATRSQARALAAYVQRRQYFSPARRQHICEHLGEPLRRRFGLPSGTNLDMFLCGLYYRTFVADQADATEALTLAAGARSPFARSPELAGAGRRTARPVPVSPPSSGGAPSEGDFAFLCDTAMVAKNQSQAADVDIDIKLEATNVEATHSDELENGGPRS